MSTSRKCGDCSLCCKVLGVPEIKADHQWCKHARPGHGCNIYADRPSACRNFLCGWLKDEDLPDYWYPKTAKIVINNFTENGVSYLAFVVDPAYPRRWLEEPWHGDIKKLAAAGMKQGSRKWTTIVVVRDARIPIINSPRLLRAAG